MIEKAKAIRTWLLFVNMAVVPAYGAILFFTNWPILKYFGLKMAVAYACAYIATHFILNNFVEKKPKEILEISVFLTTLYLIPLIDYLGGPGSFLFSALYILILGIFVYQKRWGFAYIGIVYSYLIIYILFENPQVAMDPGVIVVPAFSLILTGVGGYYLNNEIEKIKKNNESLNKIASKLTAEKSQDEAVLSAIADGVYAVDMDRNLVLLNKAAQEMIGWDEKEALGLKCKTVMKLKNDKDISICEKDCPALNVWNTGEAVFRNDACFVQRKNKKRVNLSSSYAPIRDLNGNLAGAICVFRDITKEKELERLRNEFVSTASHELRTPITATEGYLSIVTESGMCKVDDKGKEFIDKARGTLLSMSKLIKNLLSVTKIEEGKLETNITNFSIHDLVIEVIDVFKKSATAKGIVLELKESKTLSTNGKKAIGRSLNVHADREMIREVLNNLVENAIKFTTKGGVTLSIDYDEEYSTVNIEDTGMGMPPEAQKHLFEKFYRVDNTATREVGGTGLGLYITRSIIETFGGRIWVDSKPEEGSKFHFTVPLSLD